MGRTVRREGDRPVSNYAPGTENDPRAPWNQVEDDTIEWWFECPSCRNEEYVQAEWATHDTLRAVCKNCGDEDTFPYERETCPDCGADVATGGTAYGGPYFDQCENMCGWVGDMW